MRCEGIAAFCSSLPVFIVPDTSTGVWHPNGSFRMPIRYGRWDFPLVKKGAG